MQMVKNIFIALCIIWFALLVFMPKRELYYQLEKELAKQEIIISGEKIEEGWFSLTLKEPSVYLKGIKIATIEEIDIFTLLFYTKVELKTLLLDKSLKAIAPQQTEYIVLSHSLLSPLQVLIGAQGQFGTVNGHADLKERKVTIDFTEAKEIGMIKSLLKKDEKGWHYERSF